jgi:hypothetical protein
VIVDFAVERDGDILIVREDGLVAGSEVDNLETRSAQRAKAGLECALLVRPTMNQRGGGALNAARLRQPTFVSETNYSTQARDPLLLFQNQLRNSRKLARGCWNFRNWGTAKIYQP